ncbi:MAG: class I SAM-dependent methyltransferase [Thaumarchaeota archaeon]|nr:class I SAM-dependent methyltransferase [Nitrososphaerota archaeon]
MFARAGLSSGMRCVDLGCGGGEVTLKMARLVAPAGSVVGIDMDSVKLGLARKAAKERGLTNVEFRRLPVQEWDEPGSYDVAYARFLLKHLSQPVALLRRMWTALRPGGLLIVEDADFDGLSSYPSNSGLRFFLRTYSRMIERRGGDHAAGRKLYSYFLEAGIPSPDVSLVGSIHYEGEEKALPLSTLEATTDSIVSEGIASRDQIAAATVSLEEFTKDSRTLIFGPRVFQLYSRK